MPKFRRVLTQNETNQASGAITCTLNPNPINLADLAIATALGALAGPQMAILAGGGNFLSQSWICRF
ncbi:hypothetical protein DF038_23985 [Burkholderia cepacia]|nr:hypothetical protein DF045_24850 [Burkholderia cepacia]RRA20812.1 hypothetical protein DF038_23985 [Burkholderia cepacia]